MENYKNIDNFSKYQISNLGNVKSFWGKTEKILKPSLAQKYQHVIMIDDQGKQKTKRIHRLVAESFIPNIEDRKEVDHIDGNTNNNNCNNLRWATHSQNNINKLPDKNNTSGHRGIDFMKNKNKWRARIKINQKEVHLGIFDTFEEALKIRCENEIIYFKEFRRNRSLFEPTNNIT